MRRSWVFAGATLSTCALLVLAPGPASAETELVLPHSSAELTSTRLLGTVAVPGLGPVRISGRRDGLRVLLRATTSDDSLVGRAEAPIGLAKTPIAVRTPSGLEEITLHWSPHPGEEGRDQDD